MSLLWKTAINQVPGDDPEDYGIPYRRGMDDHFPDYMVERHEYDLQPDDEVYATQHYLDPDHPAIKNFDPSKAAAAEDMPSLVAMGGESFINDGHHRIAGARKAHRPIRVEVWSNPEEWD